MNLIYLTTHILDADFAALTQSKKPNPAGQNFHGKLIRALGLNNSVHVYSLLSSLTLELEEKAFPYDDHIKYTYTRGAKNRYIRALTLPTYLSSLISKDNRGQDQNVVLYDSLNATLGLTAIKAAKILSCPLVAVLTDEISNITGVDISYASRIHKIVKKSSGAIALTDGLLRAYELFEKPHFVQPIYVEEMEVKPIAHPRPYIYYGGALFEKDGTADLLECFPRFSKDYDLIISGHGPMEDAVAKEAEKEEGIIFLGQIPKEQHYAYIAGADIVVNPRHYNPGLDATAVPSKVMEYLTYGKRIISSISTPIQKDFRDDINWIKSGLQEFLSAHNLSQLKPNLGREKVVSLYGKEASSKGLDNFLETLFS